MIEQISSMITSPRVQGIGNLLNEGSRLENIVQ
jgi:hypothetical protein